ncbi:MAG: serine hydrolase domain-containing protein [Lentisphaeria bacterium]
MDRALQSELQRLMDAAVADGSELGCQATLYRHGEIVADAFAGYCDPERTRKVDADTLFPVFSAGKAVASTALNRLVGLGALSYDTPVGDHWPEYAQNGKESTLVRHILNHTTGMRPRLPLPSVAALTDWQHCCGIIAGLPPDWVPGTKTRYQSTSYTWLAGELIQRVSGRDLQEYLTRELLAPNGIDRLYFGTTAAAEANLAQLQRGADLGKAKGSSIWDPVEDLLRHPAVRRACLPGFNCLTNARSLARFYACLLDETFFSRDLLIQATTLQRPAGDGIQLRPGVWELFGHGYVLSGPQPDLGQVFGHAGYGGAEGLADRKQGLAVAFTKNLLHGEQPLRNTICRLAGIPSHA